ADDDDRFRPGLLTVRPGLPCLEVGQFLADDNSAVRLLNSPMRLGVERGRTQPLSRSKAEAGVMPWTAHGVANDKTIDERPLVMRAMRANRKAFMPLLYNQHLGITDLADKLAGFLEIGE